MFLSIIYCQLKLGAICMILVQIQKTITIMSQLKNELAF